ncbi:MAG TPA: hypothetical protein H9913_10410 [Candidatus Blautia stercoripullorum]|uniref:Uncharacterized protein n=1 Tax=Candidatus Blautia stercoripullorum TaxID=2838502 RepID=A0A9D2U5E6_9FIRM|nr:hypothetical protein [Candidatus Blautia stercoripullorum]
MDYWKVGEKYEVKKIRHDRPFVLCLLCCICCDRIRRGSSFGLACDYTVD